MGVIETLGDILDWSIGADVDLPDGHERSPEWQAFRDAFIEKHPTCAFCGGKEDLNAHHIIPFQYGGLELDESNLITLCRGTFNCHLLAGHLGDYAAANPLVRADCEIWRFRFQARRVLTRMAKKEIKALRESASQQGEKHG